MKPPKEVELGKGYLWELEVALYGLDDASLKFYQKCRDILQQLGMIKSKMDPALFYRQNEEGKLDSMLVTHVDNFLHAGTERFNKEVVEKLEVIFQMGKTQAWDFKYTVFDMKQNP